MEYIFTIGELGVEVCEETAEYYLEVMVLNENHFCLASDVWHAFCRAVRISNDYFEDGFFLLTEWHLAEFESARGRWMLQCQEHENYTNNLKRLDWLVFWTEWALKKCERPAIRRLTIW